MDLNKVNYGNETIEVSNARFMSSVYKWMALGVGLSGITAYTLFQTSLVYSVLQYYTFLIVFQLGLVLGLSFLIEKMSAFAASVWFLFYSLITGVTLSAIFLVYTRNSIDSAFFTTAIAFGGLSSYGYVTKKDLGPIGSFCIMGLFGMVGFSIINLIFPSTHTAFSSQMMGAIGIIVFAGLTAYDTQKIKDMNAGSIKDPELRGKMAIRGALCLYLDFINLFLSILRIFGSRRN